MKRLYKIFATWFLCLFLVFSQFIVSFADVNSLMIRTDSNALMTMELDDSDYAIMPRSSIASVNNTIDYNNAFLWVRTINVNTNVSVSRNISLNDSGEASYIIPPDNRVERYGLSLGPGALPSPGRYKMRFDFSSDFSIGVDRIRLLSRRDYKNSSPVSDEYFFTDFSQNSGDVYFEKVVDIGSNPTYFEIQFYLDEPLSAGSGVGGVFHVEFTFSDEDPVYSTPGVGMENSDYQSDVSSSLSDLSSSVDTMTDEISGVTEAIQNLQGAMEPHYSNVLTQLHHITEQLHAFYDQIYNNIHLKEYALWQDIKTAIENIDLEVNVNLDKLKTSIDNMSQAVQNKLQSVTDTITGGYNNSGMQEVNNELSGALDELDNAEQEVLDDVNGYIEAFEYPSFDGISSGIIGALSFFGGFLHSIFLGMGEFGLIITFSLTMIFVLIIVGYHRIRS